MENFFPLLTLNKHTREVEKQTNTTLIQKQYTLYSRKYEMKYFMTVSNKSRISYRISQNEIYYLIVL